jgi:hypothetical protein
VRGITVVLLVLLGSGTAQAAEFEREERPAGASVEELESPLERSLKPRERPFGTLFRGTLARLAHLPPLFRDAQLSAQLRSYYFDHETGSGDERKAWAAGGSVGLETGRLFERVSFGARWFTSQRVAGGERKDGSRLLRPRNKGLSVMGHAFARVEITERVFAQFGRQDLSLPFVNRQDSRMIPNTFEAYWLGGRLAKLDFAAGWVDKIKPRDARDFESMAEVAGGTKDRGLAMAGVRFRPREHVDLGVINYWNPDTLNVVYAESNWSRTLRGGLALRLSGQFAHQKTLGDNLQSGEEFDTHTVGVRLATSFRNATLSFAWTSADDDAALRSPWGSYPGFLSSMIRDFNRADEKAWGVGLSYDFSRLGYPGLSLSTQFANGTGAEDESGSLPNVREWDLTFDVRPKKKLWEGLWFRARLAVVDEAGDGRDDTQARLIVYYDLPTG